MQFQLDELTGDRLDEAAAYFDQQGFLLVGGVGTTITRHFKPLMAERMGVSTSEFDAILDPDSPPVVLPLAVRERLSRIETSRELRQTLLTALEPIVNRLLGPLAHVSSTFHGQFKSGEVKPVDHGGYATDFLEVQGQYLLHQDFSGAKIATSPSAITLWVPQNSCPDFNLRVYPGSHRVGLLCEGWLPLDDPNLGWLGEPIDIEAQEGSAVIFSSLVLHGSSRPGLRRRVSCDIRFFPLCGYLPSDVHVVGDDPLTSLQRRIALEQAETLRAPLLETLAFLGQGRLDPNVRPLSILNWSNYVYQLLEGRPEVALDHFRRFVNQERGWDSVEKYTSKYHGAPIYEDTLRRAEHHVGESAAGVARIRAHLRTTSSSAHS